MICRGFVGKKQKKKKDRKKEERENNLKQSWDLERTIEFNYLIETSKAFFSPLG